MHYHFRIHTDKTGYWAECIELKGCMTQADSKEELEANIHEALNLYLNDNEDSKSIFPLPKKKVSGRNIVLAAVDPKIAFSQILRMTRLKRGLSQKQAASLIGMKNLYSYQRLESPKSANPALSTIARIKQVFPELALDLVV
ncbi:HicB family protein [Leptospira perolatii]|uniref:HicB family protein n=1 Tax=Leptospira perolatii TaxID=2023191 RepID=A0A2M9ZNS4_9LEPT|nr:type II toxin-antitoxin system HicB family antitoxin [Leptospira perolatii]PJZ70836.1 HicB family protein [Leptospira perolatii]PJZ73732.1 HicB family protein [Leptospira perolatii]